MMSVSSTLPLGQRIKNQALVQNAAFINGKFVASSPTFPVHDPANNVLLGEVASSLSNSRASPLSSTDPPVPFQVSDLGAEGAEAAILAAHAAWAPWRSVPAKEKSAILRRWFDLIIANTDDREHALSPIVPLPGEFLLSTTCLPSPLAQFLSFSLSLFLSSSRSPLPPASPPPLCSLSLFPLP